MYNVQAMNLWGMGAEKYYMFAAKNPTNFLLQKRNLDSCLHPNWHTTGTAHAVLSYKTIIFTLTATTSKYDNKHSHTAQIFLPLISLISNIPAGFVCYNFF
jgi:hypothetical protein